jgi:hypothetical protein
LQANIAAKLCCLVCGNITYAIMSVHLLDTENRNFLDMDSLLKVEELVGIPSRPYWTISFYTYKAYHYYRTGYY